MPKLEILYFIVMIIGIPLSMVFELVGINFVSKKNLNGNKKTLEQKVINSFWSGVITLVILVTLIILLVV